jgi:hypothetical protein
MTQRLPIGIPVYTETLPEALGAPVAKQALLVEAAEPLSTRAKAAPTWVGGQVNVQANGPQKVVDAQPTRKAIVIVNAGGAAFYINSTDMTSSVLDGMPVSAGQVVRLETRGAVYVSASSATFLGYACELEDAG